MCSTYTPADFILHQIKNGLEFDESIKKILILALDAQTFELHLSSEAYLLDLPDAKELLDHYLDGEHKFLELEFNSQTILLDNPKYEDLLFYYISKRPLEREAQMLIFNHPKAKELFKLHLEKHDVAPEVYLKAKENRWIPNCPF